MPNIKRDKSTVNIVCEGCGRKVNVRAYYDYTPRFCSVRCSNKAHNQERKLPYEHCTVEGCDKPNYIGGLCQMHHWRLQVHGDANYTPYKAKLCHIEGCERKHKAFGLCALHYSRKKKGLPLEFTLPKLAKKRYRILTRPNHLLADARGRVLEHRMILFDSIGYLRVPCFWCGKGLVFGENLFVDHLNHDRHDNRLENLVPTCNECNAGRTSKNPRIRKPVYSGERVGS